MSIPADIAKTYAELVRPPAEADANWRQRRGYSFERLLHALLTAEGLEPRTGYRASGEQIDGSFFLDASVFLLEAKWLAEPLPASTLYQFKGKIDGKLVGTKGVFISMSGYSEDAVDALTLGKSLNVILFDKMDMDAAIACNHGFRNILKQKLRKAAEEGAVYFPAEADTAEPSDLTIICEGNADQIVIDALAKQILDGVTSKPSIKIIVALGKYSIPKIANGLRSRHPSTKVLIVMDGDGDPQGSLDMLRKGLAFGDWVAAIPNPSIESWLDLDIKRARLHGMTATLDEYRRAFARLDVQRLRQDDRSFADFFDAIDSLRQKRKRARG
jgi:hypothetical protein